MRGFFCIEAADVLSLAVNCDLCNVVSSGFVEANAQQPSLIVCLRLPLVLVIESLWDVSQVADTVIAAAAIDVVNVVGWPFAMHIKPSNAMRKKQLFLDIQYHVAEPV